MFEKAEILGIASALARNAAARQEAIARNVANADTPGYRAVSVADFAEAFREQDGPGMQQTRAGHLASPAPDYSFQLNRPETSHLSPNGNGVSLENEMVRAAGARRDHDLALAVYGKSLGILRASLGRR